MGFVTVFLAGVILIASISFLFKNNKDRKHLPGPWTLPFIGSILQIGYLAKKYRGHEMFDGYFKKYGPVVGLRMGMTNAVAVEDFETAKFILNSEDWEARTPEYSMFQNITFDKHVGVMFAHGEAWKNNRRFTVKTLKELGFGQRSRMESDLTEEIEYFMQDFEEKRLLSPTNDVCMHSAFQLSSINLLWRILCGSRVTEEGRIMKIIKGVEVSTQRIHPGAQIQQAYPFLMKLPGATDQEIHVYANKVLHNLFEEIIVAKRSGTRKYRKRPEDFIDFYLKKIEESKAGDPVYNDEQLLQTCTDMFNAGADTTAYSLEFLVLHLLKFPEVQRKVQNEIDRVVQPGFLPRYSDAEMMPYTQAVILESMRHASITPIMIRTASCNTKLNDCFVTKDTIAILNFYKINHDVKLFGDQEFRPERFLDGNGFLLKDASSRFLNFGLGRRMCPGMSMAKMSMFTMVTNFFQRYTAEISPRHPNVSPDNFTSGITNQPVSFTCTFHLRNQEKILSLSRS